MNALSISNGGVSSLRPRLGVQVNATNVQAIPAFYPNHVFTASKSSFIGHQNLLPSRNLKSQLTKSRTLRLQTMASAERSYVMIKPDGVQRGLVGEIISRFEKKGFVLKGLKLFQTSKEIAEEHYKDLSEKPFFKKLVEYIISGPVVAMVWEGPGVVASARKLIGSTNPLTAEPGTIRGDLAIQVGRNVIHGSDSVENGEREIGLWFEETEIVDWEPTLTPWLIE